jgi:hypothetical protein
MVEPAYPDPLPPANLKKVLAETVELSTVPDHASSSADEEKIR